MQNTRNKNMFLVDTPGVEFLFNKQQFLNVYVAAFLFYPPLINLQN